MNDNQVAKGVRVKLNDTFEIHSLSDKYLACEPIITIADNNVYIDSIGEYVYVRGGSGTTLGIAYLSQLDIELSTSERSAHGLPLYSYETINYNQDLSRFKNAIIE